MHFTGRTWRPFYEADSVILQSTSGCAYGRCSFCSLYRGEAFRVSPLAEFEADLAEIQRAQPNARRVFWTGASPFVLRYEELWLRAMLTREYLPKCRSIAMFASIRDIRGKEVWQLRRLRAAGIDGLSIGVESGDDETLALVNKGYTAAEVVEQCRKLDEAGIEYYVVYMTGLAGRGGGPRNAANSARCFNRVNPRFVSVTSLTLFPGTPLYRRAQEGRFVPAGEAERLQELQTLIRGLELRTHLFANSVSNFYPLTAFLPKERDKAVAELQGVLDTVGEEEMAEYRKDLKTLG